MTKKMWLVIALSVTITVLAVSYFVFGIVVFDVGVIALAFTVASKTVLSGGKILALFFKQALLKTLTSLLSKRVLRPLYGIFGLTVVIKHVKERVSPKIAKFKEAAKARWANSPRLARAATVGFSAAAVCAMGYGIWIFVPLTVSLLVFIVSRVQTILLDGVIHRHTVKAAKKLNKRLRPHKKHRFVRFVRTTRSRLLKRERRVAAQIKLRISK